MAKLGDVYIHVEEENLNSSVNATQYGVESGEPFTDHIEKKPSEMDLTVFILGDNYMGELEKLKGYQRTGKLLKFVGRSAVDNVVILNLNRKYTAQVENGVAVQITLRKIRVADTPWIKMPPKKKPSVKPPTKGGEKKPTQKKERPAPTAFHTVKAGDSYYALAKRYGTTVERLRTLNNYPDRSIPVNAKLRIK
ncbi:LysM peptidoglycan-binding domain-containing protein [Exiguobacterium sp. s5]|uniref:LysM peptidoglycan-binding domain-containing protein n=1 Tax=Exiguobacterium sp. s5 TaxID=2751239 RepID=UPI001BECAA4C|nr:LysM peptidoglycan-binding domain-containing protein [Exiguobacterium sp. s5]